MSIRYAISNYITDDSELYSSSEDALYVLENLYNVRPSKPFRFEGVGVTSGAIPEWVCIDLLAAKTPSFFGIFNHNMVLDQSGDLLDLKACDDACPGESGACNWDLPDHEISLLDRPTVNFPNLCRNFNWGAHRYWMVEVVDAGNPDGYVEWGDMFIGELQSFTNARLQPGRADGPVFFGAENVTYYGQIWSSYYAEAEHFSIKIQSTNDPTQVDELRLFLSAVRQAGGKFVFIPDDHFKFCYYVYMTNMGGFGQQIIKGSQCENYEWNIELRTLVRGASLLG